MIFFKEIFGLRSNVGCISIASPGIGNRTLIQYCMKLKPFIFGEIWNESDKVVTMRKTLLHPWQISPSYRRKIITRLSKKTNRSLFFIQFSDSSIPKQFHILQFKQYFSSKLDIHCTIDNVRLCGKDPNIVPNKHIIPYSEYIK